MRTILASSLLIFSFSVYAIPVTWTLNDAAFDDGGIASGSFTYDADANIYSDINISVTAGSNIDFGSAVYDEIYSTVAGINPDELLMAQNPTVIPGDSLLKLFFSADLTNSGGTVAIEAFPSGGSREDTADLSGFPRRYLVSGSVSAVPIPAAVWLFGSALVGLGWMRRKQTA